MASLNDVFPGYGDKQMVTKQRAEINRTTRSSLTCPVCGAMAIRNEVHLGGLCTCPIGHKWTAGENGQKQTRQGMFFDRPVKPDEAENNLQFRQFVKGPSMNPNLLMQMNNPYHNPQQHEQQYQELVRSQSAHLERPRDWENFEWSMRTQRNPPF